MILKRKIPFAYANKYQPWSMTFNVQSHRIGPFRQSSENRWKILTMPMVSSLDKMESLH